MPDFELNKSDWYIPQNIAENEFLGTDDYGNTWYSVKFQGDAGTHLWLAKEMPEEGKAYFGHFEKTKSGKSLRFKRDKEEDAPSVPDNARKYSKSPEDKEDIARAVALKAAVDLHASTSDEHKSGDAIIQTAEGFLAWLKGEKADVPEEAKLKEEYVVREPDEQWSKDPVFDPETGDRIM